VKTFPIFACDQPPKLGATQSKLLAQHRISCSGLLAILNDRQSRFSAYLGRGVPFSVKICAVVNSVFKILAVSSPAQVRKIVVQFIAIRKMPALFSFWTRTDKSFQDKTMDVSEFDPAIFAQIYEQISCISDSGFEYPPGFKIGKTPTVNHSREGADPALIRDFVESFIFKNWFPFFFSHSALYYRLGKSPNATMGWTSE
jgi:hypothetical protein